MNGYNAIFSVYLAYSALDILTSTIAKNYYSLKPFERYIKRNKNPKNNIFEIYKLNIENKELAAWLRDNHQLMEILADETSHSIEKETISFCSHNHDNLISVCQGIRHLVAHGNLTSTGAQAHSTKYSKVIKECALLVINAADQLVVSLLDEIEFTNS